ncbi:ribose 5-phosphate isomerase A [Acidianus sp. HS-5]|uniref:ribose 5-phosphate isomerase A n=1 Tax=Acidianus sp. HS-5 TaxID=2886040 RepID=UPI001F00F544|nr:ribose 5-phosphate isomerase A [Acidianus sp. HS-5]BDC19273.1 ribose-5-phosphate isomerase [Acidianus sp. HS-5]
MDAKEIVAKQSIEYIKDKRIIGIGTGKTARKLIEMISQISDFKNKYYIASSIDSEIELSRKGFSVISLFSGIIPDVYVDSFDFLLRDNNGKIVLIKGGGGALFREKLLTINSKEKIFIGEINKLKIPKLLQIPIEVVPVSLNYILSRISNLGFNVKVREGSSKIGPTISDNGNIILDIETDITQDLCKLNEEVSNIVGVIETGIFCDSYNTIILADSDGRIEIIKKS